MYQLNKIFFIIILSTDQELRLSRLIDPNREEYSTTEVFQQWDNTFSEMTKVLLQQDKKEHGIEKYFKSFACLSPPLTISLVSIM